MSIVAYSFNAIYYIIDNIAIKKLYLKVSFIDKESITSMHNVNTDKYFSLLVEVYSDDLLTSIYQDKDFTISLNVDPLITILGYQSELSIQGSLIYSNLMIETENTYIIYAFCPRLETSNDVIIEVKNYYLKLNFISDIVLNI